MKKLKFKTGALEYYKKILTKVSFSAKLFRKEYFKAKMGLDQKEGKILDGWLFQHKRKQQVLKESGLLSQKSLALRQAQGPSFETKT